ncbi:MAG: helix-turn-helix transcriptional regulator [Bacteroidetes bacterium]|nr:helix-turn-helix transcriptional regulator [Bacteroidota bacterium]
MIENINLKIRSIRRELDKKSVDIANSIGFSQSYYSKIKNGKANVNSRNLEKIAKALNVKKEYILSKKILLENSEESLLNKKNLESVNEIEVCKELIANISLLMEKLQEIVKVKQREIH